MSITSFFDFFFISGRFGKQMSISEDSLLLVRIRQDLAAVTSKFEKLIQSSSNLVIKQRLESITSDWKSVCDSAGGTQATSFNKSTHTSLL